MKKKLYLFLIFVILATGSCTQNSSSSGPVFRISAIPDQDPEVLQRLYGSVEEYLEKHLQVQVEYVPVVDYTAAVTAFRTGDLDMVWFGGLTGVQARLQVEGARAIIQRDIDEKFQSVFICNRMAGVAPFTDIQDLSQLQGHSFTFGSESSTSGRLMPQYFLQEAEVIPERDFTGGVGFSGSHDKTIKLVEAGSFDCGALNVQVWENRMEENLINQDLVIEVWRTPTYHDYHWVIRPDVNDRFGNDFTEKVIQAFLILNKDEPDQKIILDLFGAGSFIITNNDNYSQIEEIGRELGLIK